MAASAAARNWKCFDAIVAVLKRLENDQTLLVQSGKPVGVFQTHADAPRVLLANSNLVPHWATWEHFNELDRRGLMMFGQMTAGSWIYIGSQGIVQGTYETFVAAGKKHFGGNLAGRWILTGGLGGMGGAQPLAATMAGAAILAVECDESRIDRRLQTGYLDRKTASLDEALGLMQAACREGRALSVGLLGNCGSAAGSGPPGHCAGHHHRSDQRPRSAQRLSACRLDTGKGKPNAGERPGGGDVRGAAVDRGTRPRDVGIAGPRRGGLRLRQQHPPGGKGRGRGGGLRFSRLRAGVYPPAVLRRRWAVPVGGPFRRSRRHLQDRREGKGIAARRSAFAPLAGHGAGADSVPGAAGADLLGGAKGPRPAGAGLQRDGGAASCRRLSSSDATTSIPARWPARTARRRACATARTRFPTGRC